MGVHWVVMFKDGDALNCDAHVFGPWTTYEEAYEFHCNIPAPRNGGHKFVKAVVYNDSEDARFIIERGRLALDEDEELGQ